MSRACFEIGGSTLYAKLRSRAPRERGLEGREGKELSKQKGSENCSGKSGFNRNKKPCLSAWLPISDIRENAAAMVKGVSLPPVHERKGWSTKLRKPS